ncbi:MAG: hypothetical protein B6D38_01880 [Anaerolineae bacterium UTCFX1]|jgi:GAF domain-containing protein|nr:MAG: hypothetical protein B6D38_01880 [Anaerolineae bacterium UTCFX1]
MENRRYPTIRARLTFALTALTILFAAGISFALYRNFRTEAQNALRHRLTNIAALAGLQQNGDLFQNVHAENDENFQIIQAQNLKIRGSDSELKWVYTMRKDEQGVYFVVDGALPNEDGYSPYGLRYEEPGPTLLENFDTMNGVILEPDYYTDEYGSFLSAYTPIFNSDGQRVGVLGVDITVDTIRAQERAYLIRILIVDFVAGLLIILASYLLAGYLTKPIVKLTSAINRISGGELTHRIAEIPGTRELAEFAVNLNTMATNLHGLIANLENRVAERTEDLTRRTEQLRAASFIARQTAEEQELSALLNAAVNLITSQFGFYHAGVFLINETGDQVVLLAASSEGGLRMAQRGYAMKVGTQGIVGYVAAQKKSRIALDVGADAVFFNNPDLPLTRSEVALPLTVHGQLLGVLDIQSDAPSAFTMQDVGVLETLANQIAVAIEKAQLFAEARATLSQVEALMSIRTHEAWSQKLKMGRSTVTYTPFGLRPEKTQTIEPNALSIPILLRGQAIGSISIARKGDAPWGKHDEGIVSEIATQIGLAADSVRLLEEATQRAEQEKTISELAYRFSQAFDLDSLLQIAARELAQLPGMKEASVYVGNLTDPEAPKSQNLTRRNGS